MERRKSLPLRLSPARIDHVRCRNLHRQRVGKVGGKVSPRARRKLLGEATGGEEAHTESKYTARYRIPETTDSSLSPLQSFSSYRASHQKPLTLTLSLRQRRGLLLKELGTFYSLSLPPHCNFFSCARGTLSEYSKSSIRDC